MRSCSPACLRRSANRFPGAGFTLVEMMVVVALMSVLAAIAVPSFRGMIVDQRVRAGASVLQESLWYARSEAIKRNQNVFFVVRSLAAGWEVRAGSADNSTLLRVQQGISGLETSFSSGDSATFVYNPFGRLSGGGAALKITVSDAGQSHARCIEFDQAARPKLRQGACS